MPSRLFFVASLVLVSTVSGCGKPDGPARYPMKGTVKYKGEEVPAGTIFFGPVDAAKGTPGNGSIDKGAFVIEKGLAAGEYVVTVEGYKISPKDRDAAKSQGSPPDNTGVPRKYATAKTSDLRYTVTEGPNVKEFDLQD